MPSYPAAERSSVPLKELSLTPDQALAVEAVREGSNVFVTGAAGTGKSTLVGSLRGVAGNTAFLAPTGMAAIAIGGSTIHRFFRFPTGILDPDDVLLSSSRGDLRRLFEPVDAILMDEISMVRSDLFHAMDLRLRVATGVDFPFGGRQVIAVGDYGQLPPVVRGDGERQYLDDVHGGPYAFCSESWREAGFAVVSLRSRMRQRDESLALALDLLRAGDASGLDRLNERVVQDIPGNAVCLCATNRQAAAINESRLEALPGPEAVLHGEAYGAFPERDYPADAVLRLREGARVVFLANDEAGYCTGDTGEVVRLTGSRAIVLLDRGEIVEVAAREWPVEEYVADGGLLRKRVLGLYRQLPLRLAWAMTIHRAQGMTLPSAAVDLGSGTFAHGQLYVALSRVRSLDSLFLRRPLRPGDMVFDREAEFPGLSPDAMIP